MEEITHDLVLAELYDLACDLNERWSGGAAACMLLGPELLTVFSDGDTITSKESHFGGETFVPFDARVSGQTIVVRFKPCDTSRYQYMEMFGSQALDHLDGFSTEATTPAGTYQARIREIVRKRSILSERARMKDKFEIYKDLGFGDF